MSWIQWGTALLWLLSMKRKNSTKWLPAVAIDSHAKNTRCLHAACGVIMGIWKMWKSSLPRSDLDNNSSFWFFFHVCFWTIVSLIFQLIFLHDVFLLYFFFYCSTMAFEKRQFNPLCMCYPYYRIDNKATWNLGVLDPDKHPFGGILSICETLEWLCGSQRCHQSPHRRRVEW